MILGYIAPHLIKENIGLLIQCDMSKEMLAMSKEVPDIEVCPLIELYPNIVPISISLCMSDLEHSSVRRGVDAGDMSQSPTKGKEGK